LVAEDYHLVITSSSKDYSLWSNAWQNSWQK